MYGYDDDDVDDYECSYMKLKSGVKFCHNVPKIDIYKFNDNSWKIIVHKYICDKL